MSKRVVKVIQPKAKLDISLNAEPPKKRVAAYARVSTDSDEQLSSYEAQVEFYTNHIKSNPAWDFVEVYTDEGITGTNTKNRDGFNRMVQDALDGKIDLILTKSVSRFARNTVDSLTTVRKLKEKGVEVYFEKENIYTMDSKGELFITIMSSLAQEESRSISENVTWGKRKSAADGKVTLSYKRFLGYEKGEDGLPKIVESEARIVRQIYTMFLEGKTYRTIADNLTDQGIPTPGGKVQWSVSTVRSILGNEKYKGCALLQKTFTVDFLTKATKDFKEGKVCGMHMFGFRLKSGQLQVVPDEAEVVRSMFSDYLSGMGVLAIVKKYRELGYAFSTHGVYGMLRNEKYQGDMLLQKRFVEDHISKREIKNIGQLPQYHVTGSHEAIIDRDTFAEVQMEIARRAERYHPKPQEDDQYPFTGRIRCGICGAPYKRKHNSAGTKYEKVVWICSTYNTLGKSACASQQIPEDILENIVSEAGGLEHIIQIQVPAKNLITIFFKDGTSQDVEWQHPSRSQSWTVEMREAARSKALKQHREGGK